MLTLDFDRYKKIIIIAGIAIVVLSAAAAGWMIFKPQAPVTPPPVVTPAPPTGENTETTPPDGQIPPAVTQSEEQAAFEASQKKSEQKDACVTGKEMDWSAMVKYAQATTAKNPGLPYEMSNYFLCSALQGSSGDACQPLQAAGLTAGYNYCKDLYLMMGDFMLLFKDKSCDARRIDACSQAVVDLKSHLAAGNIVSDPILDYLAKMSKADCASLCQAVSQDDANVCKNVTADGFFRLWCDAYFTPVADMDQYVGGICANLGDSKDGCLSAAYNIVAIVKNNKDLTAKAKANGGLAATLAQRYFYALDCQPSFDRLLKTYCGEVRQ